MEKHFKYEVKVTIQIYASTQGEALRLIESAVSKDVSTSANPAMVIESTVKLVAK